MLRVAVVVAVVMSLAGCSAEAQEAEAGVLVTTVTFVPSTIESTRGDVFAGLSDAWSASLDEHRETHPADWSSEWCPLVEQSEAALVARLDANGLQALVDGAGLASDAEDLAYESLVVLTYLRLFEHCPVTGRQEPWPRPGVEAIPDEWLNRPRSGGGSER